MSKIWRLFICICSLSFLTFSADLVLANDVKLIDRANLFSEADKAQLERDVTNLISETNMDAVILTINNAEGYATRDYAADYYDYNGYGIGEHYDGFIFIIDMDNREYYVVTAGKTKALLSSSRIDSILDNAEPYMFNGNYSQAATAVMESVRNFNAQGMPDGYIYNETTGQLVKQRRITGLEFFFAFLIASIAGIASYLTVSSKYNLKKSTYSYNYASEGAINLTNNTNELVDVRVTKRFIPKPTTTRGGSNRGGGSFTSGSGRSHGGGGRGF